MKFSIPKFLDGEPLPDGYFNMPDPYSDPPASAYDIVAMVEYAAKVGKTVPELSKKKHRCF